MAITYEKLDIGTAETGVDFGSVFVEALVLPAGGSRPVAAWLLGKNQKHNNLSAFGGGLEGDETSLQAALRELKEETSGGLDLTTEQLKAWCYATVKKTIRKIPKVGIIYFLRLPRNKQVGDHHVFGFGDLQGSMAKNLETETRKEWRENSRLVAIPKADLGVDIDGNAVDNIRVPVLATLQWASEHL